MADALEEYRKAKERAQQKAAAGPAVALTPDQQRALDEYRRLKARTGGGGGGDRNLLQQVGHVAKSPLRLGGRVLTSGPAKRTFDILDRPVQAVKGGIVGMGGESALRLLSGPGGAGIPLDPVLRERVGKGGIVEAAKGAHRGLTGKEKITGTQAVKAVTGVQLPDSGPLGFAFNFGVDVGLDPLTYVTLGASAPAKAALRKVSQEVGTEAAEAIAKHGLKAAVKKGLVDPAVVEDAVRRATSAQKGVELAKGGADRIVAREMDALANRGRGGLGFAGRTVIPGQSVVGRAAAAPGRAIAASRPAQATAKAFSTKARLAAVAGEDTAGRAVEAFSKARALPENVTGDVVDEIAASIKATGATNAQLRFATRHALEGVPGTVPDNLVPLVDTLKRIRTATTESQVASAVLSAAKMHEEERYLLRALTDAGRKVVAKAEGTAGPFARLSDTARDLRQGGSILPRSIAPDADIDTVEAMLVQAYGPLKPGQTYLEQNAAKLVAGRAQRAAKAVAQSKLVDDLSRLVDKEGNPLVDLGNTRAEKAVTKEQAALTREAKSLAKAQERQGAKAVAAADALTSAQDLAVAARVAPPAPGPVLPRPDVAPVIRRSQRAVDATGAAARGADQGLASTASRREAAEAARDRVIDEVEKIALAAADVGAATGKQQGRSAGREMTTAQLRRSRAEQLARAEARRSRSLATKADRIKAQIDDLDAARVVTVEPRPGLVAVQVGERTVYAVPEIAKELQRSITLLSSDDAVRGFLRFYDRVLNLGKGYATVPLVGTGFHARNAQGNIWNNFVAGVTDPRWYQKAGRIQRLGEKGGLSASEQRVLELAREHGVLNRGAQEADLAAPDAFSKLGGAGAGGTVKRRLSPFSDENVAIASGRAVGSAVENNARMAHFLWALDKTGDAERAAMSVKRHLFDYGDLTDLERKFFKRVLPFWTWMRKNTPLQLAEMVRQPGKFTGLAHLAAPTHEDYELDLPPVAAVDAISTPFQPGGLASLPGLGLLGAFKTQAFGKTIPVAGTEGFVTIPPDRGTESRGEALLADLFPLYGRFGKVSSAKRVIDEEDWLRFFLGLRERSEPKK